MKGQNINPFANSLVLSLRKSSTRDLRIVLARLVNKIANGRASSAEIKLHEIIMSEMIRKQ